MVFSDEFVQRLDILRLAGVAHKRRVRRVDDDQILAADGGDHGVDAAEASKAGIPMPSQGA